MNIFVLHIEADAALVAQEVKLILIANMQATFTEKEVIAISFSFI